MTRIKCEHQLEFDSLVSIFKNAIDSFHSNDLYLLKIDISEQCICGRLAMHLQHALIGTEYSDYVVDCEYNRGMQSKDSYVKKVDNKTARLDIAVHKREYDEAEQRYWNLNCIEMKKANATKDVKELDKKRLLILTQSCHGFHYKLGAFIVADRQELRIENMYSSLAEDDYNTEIEKCGWV